MTEINLIKIDGKPLQKLIEVISNGIGTIYKPRAIKNKADAEAYRIKIIERAKSQALAERKEIEAEALERMQTRLLHKEATRQLNIDNVSNIAAELLNDETSVSDEPVNEDWTSRFFNIVEDISDEEMQMLWGKILADEVKQPKSYSLRTLEMLKNLSKEEAEIFTKFAQLKMTSGDSNIIYNHDNGKFLESEFGITLSDRLLLIELGLIYSEKKINFGFNLTDNYKQSIFLDYGQKRIVLYTHSQTLKHGIQVLMFTKIGVELSRLIEPTFNLNYLEKICSSFKGPNVIIKYGDLISQSNGELAIVNEMEYS